MVTREDVQKTERMVDKFVKEMDELKYNIERDIEKIKECIENLKGSKYDNVYRTKFVVGRDIRIVEKVLENM